MSDYGITWKYIVEAMEKKFGYSPSSEIREPMGRFIHLLDIIWDDYYDNITRRLEP